MFISFDPGKTRPAKNPLAKIVAFFLGTVALATALIFSFLIFAALAVIGTIAWLYFSWKTRNLREAAHRRHEEAPTWEDAARASESRRAGGRVIEGEATEMPDEERGSIGPPSLG
jgi:hypothetical protein